MIRRKSRASSGGAVNRAKEFERARAPKLAARIALSLSVMVACLIALAAHTGVPNVTRAPGEILPKGHYSQIETLGGGIVEAIHVTEGQIVDAGTPLVDLRQPDLARQLDTLTAQHEQEQTKFENLSALRTALDNPTPPTVQTADQLRASGLISAAEQLKLHVQSQHVGSLASSRHQETIEILVEAHQFYQDRVATKMERMKSSRMLRDQGLMTERQYQAEEDQLDALKVALNTARVDLAEARSELVRMTTDLAQAQIDLQNSTRVALEEAQNTLRILDAERADVSARLADLSILAPEAGVIQSVALPNLGEVIEPGETLFEIAPVQRGLMIEARIPTGDIGHINPNQTVTIGVDTFDPRRVGKLSGELLSLSPVPLTDEVTGEDYFRAAIRLDRTDIGMGNDIRPLRSGMTVVAEIVTGEQSLLAYFLKPIDNTLGVSFRER